MMKHIINFIPVASMKEKRNRMNTKLALLVSFLLVVSLLTAQTIEGIVLEKVANEKTIPLIGANVYWMGTTKGTSTDTSGRFILKTDSSFKQLIVSYIGYTSDTLIISNQTKVKVVLKAEKTLSEVEVIARQSSTMISSLDPIKTQLMTEKELTKAACCNLSESFETNPSVDVSYADAVSGAKQIQMLGLSGIYTQLTNENLPGTRGLSSAYGLSYTPGSWIEGIQVIKGTGSVANGYESIAGQINVELKKPEEKTEKFLLNVYANDMERTEANINYTQKVSNNLSTTLLLHGNYYNNRIDGNRDGFMDVPTGNQINAVNRWKYKNDKGLEVQLGAKILRDQRMGGQMEYNPDTDYMTTSKYGIGIDVQRLEWFGKIGYVFPSSIYKSVGLMFSLIDHQQNSYYGINPYNGRQQIAYTNLIYQSIIRDSRNKFRTGLSYSFDKYDESIFASSYKREESVPGIFYEHTYSGIVRWMIVSGIRADYNTLYGLIITPRINMKYDLREKTILRFSAGKGQRTANIFSENSGILASARQMEFSTSNIALPQGLKQEKAWNEGMNLTHNFRMNNHDGSIGLDFYRTDFINQVVVDLDKNPQKVVFYNLEGKSYSNSFQSEINYELVKNFDVRLAYRWFDVRTTYTGKLMEKPLVARNRSFVNLAYEFKKWKFDYTLNWVGKKRIPNTSSNPANYQLADYSPGYFLMNAQLTKTFMKDMDAYLGIENITNFRQSGLIIASDQPFGKYFDSSIIWGPVYGRMLYIGLRYKLK